ncbi:MAG TPA: hypothetical protein ENJ95_18510 [Bacteroidetes bacterium]|nr:hypothetical protein [Bacteroidota bacterium]
MDISFEKLHLIQKILLINDEQLINAVANFIEKKRNTSEEVDGFDLLPGAVKDLIKISQQQLKEGKSIPLGEVMAKYRYHCQR